MQGGLAIDEFSICTFNLDREEVRVKKSWFAEWCGYLISGNIILIAYFVVILVNYFSTQVFVYGNFTAGVQNFNTH